MAKQPNRYGGGARTNYNGLRFEQTTSLDEALRAAGFLVIDDCVYREGEKVGLLAPKQRLYTRFLEKQGVDYRQYNSKRWLPDEAFVNFETETVYIVEKKFQNTAGSVDEKLPGCHFKKWEYAKLMRPLGYGVEYIYVFNDWFRDPQYRDTLDYIRRSGCQYYYNQIPLDVLGL